MQRVTRIFLAIVACLLGWERPARADITWGAPTGISADTDVDTAGTLVGALAFGPFAGATVNGVSFTNFAPNIGDTTGSSGPFTFAMPSGATSGSRGPGTFDAPFGNLSLSYRDLLLGREFLGSSWTLTMSGLNPRDEYAFEWWTSISAAKFGPPGNSQLTATDANAVTLNYDPGGAEGGVGQFVIGTFTADSTGTEKVTFTSGGPIDALQLRDLGPATATPEPSSFILFGMAVTGLGVARWRKRKQTAV